MVLASMGDKTLPLRCDHYGQAGGVVDMSYSGSRWRDIVTTGEKRYKGHRQRKVQTEGFFSRNASAKPRTIQWD